MFAWYFPTELSSYSSPQPHFIFLMWEVLGWCVSAPSSGCQCKQQFTLSCVPNSQFCSQMNSGHICCCSQSLWTCVRLQGSLVEIMYYAPLCLFSFENWRCFWTPLLLKLCKVDIFTPASFPLAGQGKTALPSIKNSTREKNNLSQRQGLSVRTW